MFFQLPKVSNDLIKWPHKDKNQTLNDTQQLIQSAAFCLFVSPLMILIICGEKIKQVKLSCFFLGEEIRRCNNYVKDNVINFRHFVSNLVDAHSYCVARKFCRSLFLRIGIFLCFAETDFCS